MKILKLNVNLFPAILVPICFLSGCFCLALTQPQHSRAKDLFEVWRIMRITIHVGKWALAHRAMNCAPPHIRASVRLKQKRFQVASHVIKVAATARSRIRKQRANVRLFKQIACQVCIIRASNSSPTGAWSRAPSLRVPEHTRRDRANKFPRIARQFSAI